MYAVLAIAVLVTFVISTLRYIYSSLYLLFEIYSGGLALSAWSGGKYHDDKPEGFHIRRAATHAPTAGTRITTRLR
jgi:hypothetical protein